MNEFGQEEQQVARDMTSFAGGIHLCCGHKPAARVKDSWKLGLMDIPGITQDFLQQSGVVIGICVWQVQEQQFEENQA